MRSVLAVAAFVVAVLAAMSTKAAVVTVTAFADPWLAGQSAVPPFGTTGTPWNGGPGSLPVAIPVSGVASITLSASGLTDWAGYGCCLNIPASGASWNVSVTSPFANISGFNGPDLALVGLFDAGQQWQVFYIGTGGTFAVPDQATTLYLGVPDAVYFSGYAGAYSDNGGSYTVTYSTVSSNAVPEPATFGLLLTGIVGGAAVRRRRRLESQPSSSSPGISG